MGKEERKTFFIEISLKKSNKKIIIMCKTLVFGAREPKPYNHVHLVHSFFL